MAESETSDQLAAFFQSGIYRFSNCAVSVVFMDPVRVLNRSYSRFRVSPSTYYSRFFSSNLAADFAHRETELSSSSKKRKRKEKKPPLLNEREQAADQRHQLARPLLLKAHECLIGASELLGILRSLSCDSSSMAERRKPTVVETEPSFVELGKVWQAPLYEIALKFPRSCRSNENEGDIVDQCCDPGLVPVFNNLVVNETGDEVEAEFLSRKYVIPLESCFYMSDLGKIQNLIPEVYNADAKNVQVLVYIPMVSRNRCNPFCWFVAADSGSGFNLILIDPPWENASAHQKLMYPTLPNRYFLSLPIKKLVHSDGALVGLWVTNWERLRNFVLEELFPSWGVTYAASLFWLKVKADGSLTSDLDLFHHRPYECLLLAYCNTKSGMGGTMEDQVVISIPGDYSRKPPVGELLQKYVPGVGPPRCIELFAREMMAGWASWGNEPLHFQDSHYFLLNHEDPVVLQ
ncbi:unnamed protein product [Linum tenue]|uniref:Methyltransferase-like protein 2 n=1 Tax=Linum tenue TaxID=586396 RepID=A0AAV0RMG6_9ROSI|nr:unnamed protein product [Linum tenue]